MRPAYMTNIGGLIAPKEGLPPLNNAAGTRNGAAIDRLGYFSCTLFAQAGAEEGSPSARTLDVKLQESDDGSTGWTDISGAAITQITAVNTQARKDVNLRGVKRYIRAVEVVAFTAGTSPKLNSVCQVILGGKDDGLPS